MRVLSWNEDLTWCEAYRFRWDALEATIDYYSTMLEDWECTA